MDKDEVEKYLKQAFWDVNYSTDDLYAIFTKKAVQINAMTIERIYIRLLESYSWYKLLELVDQNQLEEMLADKILNKLRAKTLKDRYHHVARILRKTALPPAR